MGYTPTRPPAGHRWVFTPYFWHWRAKKYLYAKDYGRKAWRFLVKISKTIRR